jgi:hypothetical protein
MARPGNRLSEHGISGMSMCVRFSRAVIAVILALVWVPLTAHCELESVTGLNFLQCPSAGDCATEGSSHCDDSSCCGWEAGFYKLPRNESSACVPLIASRTVDDLFAQEFDLSTTEVLVTSTDAPPELLKSWRFFLRAALPVRAPSFAS